MLLEVLLVMVMVVEAGAVRILGDLGMRAVMGTVLLLRLEESRVIGGRMSFGRGVGVLRVWLLEGSWRLGRLFEWFRFFYGVWMDEWICHGRFGRRLMI